MAEKAAPNGTDKKEYERKPKQTEFFDDDGNKITKNAWKKLQKKKAAEAKAAAKAAKASKGPKKVNESNLSPNQYFELRTAMVAAEEEKGNHAYPHKFEVSQSIPQFLKTYNGLKPSEEMNNVAVSVAGRVMGMRAMSKNLRFYDVQADGASVQIVANAKAFQMKGKGNPKQAFLAEHQNIRRGDIIGATGYPGKTKAGELSVFATNTTLLSPCLRMLPSNVHGHGITSQETRYRQRYLDLILRDKTRQIFYTRAKIIAYVRRFLDSRGFLEVETPMLNQMAGGAAAKPFKTWHNDLGIPMFLRIAPELYLKELIVGGLDRVYEIGRQFRNEGIDMTHNPEFTTCEFYCAYWDYNDLMDVTEEMVSGLVHSLFGSYKVKYTRPPSHSSSETVDSGEAKEGEVIEIDFQPPWPRYSMVEELEKRGKFKIPRPLDSDECAAFLKAKCEELEVECPPPETSARLLDKLVGHFIEDTVISPVFITEHPVVMSPLAKYHRSKPEVTERFELFVAGSELCNAYTELNNPKVQRERFVAQVADKDKGDDEAMGYDKDFCTALEYALPPTGGWGLGIDRLTMFLTDSNQIKEVLLFPQMKPSDDEVMKHRKALKEDGL